MIYAWPLNGSILLFHQKNVSVNTVFACVCVCVRINIPSKMMLSNYGNLIKNPLSFEMKNSSRDKMAYFGMMLSQPRDHIVMHHSSME